MNHNPTNRTNKPILLMKGAMAGVLIFGIGAGSAYASDEPTPVAVTTTDTASATSSTATPGTVATGTTAAGTTAATGAATTTGTTAVSAAGSTAVSPNKPGLLPGDFFYFIKTVYEQIRLALTSDDVKEARLLAQFAGERLAEANALLDAGKPEQAEELLNKSLATQEKAVVKIDAGTGTEEEPAAAEDDKAEETLKAKTDIQHNIVALSDALAKVHNPKAQQALLANIEKAYGHLEKKLAKREAKMGAIAEASAAATAPSATPAPSATNAVTTATTAPAAAATPAPAASASVDGTMTVQVSTKFTAEAQERSDSLTMKSDEDGSLHIHVKGPKEEKTSPSGPKNNNGKDNQENRGKSEEHRSNGEGKADKK